MFVEVPLAGAEGTGKEGVGVERRGGLGVAGELLPVLESLPAVRVKAEVDYDAVECSEHRMLVLGGAGRGPREKVAERCDFLVRIPRAGSVSSPNVSVAAGIALFEVERQRSTKGE